MKELYTITIELEGWVTASEFQNVIEKLQYDYNWKEIKKIGMPKRKAN